LRKLAAICAALIVGAMLAACGEQAPSGSGSDAADFRAQADASCAETAERIRDSRVEHGLVTNKRQMLVQIRRELPIWREILGLQREIDIPDEFGREWQRYVATRKEIIRATKGQIKPIRKGFDRRVERLEASIPPAENKGKAAAGRMDLEDCALVLSEEDAEQVREASEEILTSRDPTRACDELLVPGTVKVTFGSFRKCRTFKRNRANRPRRVAFGIVEGIDNTVATLPVRRVGGKFDGQRTIDTLYYVDGDWRLFESVPAAD